MKEKNSIQNNFSIKKLWGFYFLKKKKKCSKTEHRNSLLVQKIEQMNLQWARVDTTECFFSLRILLLATLTYK